MRFFYQRHETEQQIKITLSSTSFYVMLVMLATWFVNQYFFHSAFFSQAFVPVVFTFMFIRFFFILKVQKEVWEATKRGVVKTSGSKFSLSNPFTYWIEK